MRLPVIAVAAHIGVCTGRRRLWWCVVDNRLADARFHRLAAGGPEQQRTPRIAYRNEDGLFRTVTPKGGKIIFLSQCCLVKLPFAEMTPPQFLVLCIFCKCMLPAQRSSHDMRAVVFIHRVH